MAEKIGLGNETDLLYQTAGGNTSAFATIYSFYSPMVYRFIRRYLKSAELTDDLTQEIFIKIWEKREVLANQTSFKAYLFTVSKNHTLNFLKRAAIDTTAKNVILNSYVRNDSVEEDFQTKDYLAYLQTILNKLSPQSRQVFKLCRQEYKSYDEAAEILGISRSAVKKHMIKSMKVLSNSVKNDLGIHLSLFLLLSKL